MPTSNPNPDLLEFSEPKRDYEFVLRYKSEAQQRARLAALASGASSRPLTRKDLPPSRTGRTRPPTAPWRTRAWPWSVRGR